MYVIQDVEKQILGSTAVYPWIEVFVTATGSKAGVVCMAACITVAAFGSTINVIAAGSRQAWSFARDEGLPFPQWFMKITIVNKVPLPINAMVSLQHQFVLAREMLSVLAYGLYGHPHHPCAIESRWFGGVQQ